MTRRTFTAAIALLAALPLTAASAQSGVSPAEVRAIAKDAYVYGFPVVDSYRIQYAYFIDSSGREYKAAWNHLVNTPRVYTPADTAVQTPNSDTPYSWLGLDLRTEPMVLTVPQLGKRYFSVQFIDAYTFNFDYLGSRATGNEGGSYLVAGPSWKGEAPTGISKVVRSETEFAWAVYRTQLLSPDDLDNVKKVQAGYKVQPLSAFLGQPAPAAAPAINFIKPLSADDERSSLEFFNILNFALQYTPTHSSETELMARFAKIGIGAGKTLDVSALSPEVKAAFSQGMADAWADLATLEATQISTGKVTSGDLFGSREFLKNNYLYRMAGTKLGIGGNSRQEAMYPMYLVDSAGQKLSGANKYTVRFAPDQLPPVNAFWSLTMYEMPSSLLVANPINRYLLNSPMLPQMVKDADGGLTFYIQNESPGKDREANWLPAPKGPFVSAMRLYWPKEEALDGTWRAPKMTKAN
jgi:hypothetical protein